MQISSTDFDEDMAMPTIFTCDGDNLSPHLDIEDVPEGTESLVLIMDDPDAPAGTWTHWLVFNINPKTTEFLEGSAPSDSIEGTNSSGFTGYQGPCPQSGKHRYFFRLFALDTRLDLSREAIASDVEAEMAGHILAEDSFNSYYERKAD